MSHTKITTVVKQRILLAALVLLTIWPAIHIVIAKRTGMSSWKLAGWGMYAVPRLKPFTMEIYGRSDPARGFERLVQPSLEVRICATDTLRAYRWLSTLTRPHRLADAVFDALPRWTELKISMFEPILIAETGMIATREVVYDYSSSRGLQAITVGELTKATRRDLRTPG